MTTTNTTINTDQLEGATRVAMGLAQDMGLDWTTTAEGGVVITKGSRRVTVQNEYDWDEDEGDAVLSGATITVRPGAGGASISAKQIWDVNPMMLRRALYETVRDELV